MLGSLVAIGEHEPLRHGLWSASEREPEFNSVPPRQVRPHFGGPPASPCLPKPFGGKALCGKDGKAPSMTPCTAQRSETHAKGPCSFLECATARSARRLVGSALFGRVRRL